MSSTHIRRLLACAAAGASLLVAASSPADEPAISPVPDPSLGPQAVVRIQLEALRGNDAADRGIAVAFRFASPGNRASTGPVGRFGRMIKEGPYRLMLEYRSAQLDPVRIDGDRARQQVTLVGDGATMVYVFYLSRQRVPECPEGCWMTDAVSAAAFGGRAA